MIVSQLNRNMHAEIILRLDHQRFTDKKTLVEIFANYCILQKL